MRLYKGDKMPEEQKRKLSLAKKGCVIPMETRKKI